MKITLPDNISYLNRIFLLLFLLANLVGCTEENARLALGTLERDRITLTSTAAELITAIPISDGQIVSTGDILVQLDNKLQQSLVYKAEADLLQAEANLDKLRNGARPEEVAAASARVAAARIAVEEAERDVARFTRLAAQGAIAQATLLTAQSNRDSKQATLEDAQEQLLQLTNGTRDEDLRQAEAQLKAAAAVLEREQQNLNNLTIVATRDGTIDDLPWNVGERVFVGAPLVILLADSTPFARVYIPEPVRASIALGDTLTVTIDGVTESYNGTVRWLSKEPAFTPYYALNSGDRSRLVYLAEVQLGDNANDLPSGIPVQVILP